MCLREGHQSFCLPKIFHRFSEDVDISYSHEPLTPSQKKRIKAIFFESIGALGLQAENPENICSGRYFNRYTCPYEQNFPGIPGAVIAEWATQTPSFPLEEKSAQTLLGQYLASMGQAELVEKYDLGSFTVKTIIKKFWKTIK
mgnify:CR=1 FL=1